jgi:hypothetical protein
MDSGAVPKLPACPVCQQSAAVVPILYGFARLEKARKERAKGSDFDMGGHCSELECWHCKRCQHSFVDRQLSIPHPAMRKAENDSGGVNPDSRDGMPIRSMKRTFHRSGITVTLTKADIGKGYFVIVNHPNGISVIVEADSRARAKQIASAYRRGEKPLIM